MSTSGPTFGGVLETSRLSADSYIDDQASGLAVETDQEDHALLSSIARMALLE
jgi:hypothetical protein